MSKFTTRFKFWSLFIPIQVTKVVLQKGWRCLDCTVCEGCGKPHDEGRLILCDECDISYHIYCLEPALDHVPKGTWKCKWWVLKCRALNTFKLEGEVTTLSGSTQGEVEDNIEKCGDLNFAFDQWESEVNLHRVISSPELPWSVSPAVWYNLSCILPRTCLRSVWLLLILGSEIVKYYWTVPLL